MSVSIAESAILVLKSAADDTTTGIVVADEDGGLSARVEGEVLTESTSGRPSHGECENEFVARRLIERLNLDGGTWGPLVVHGSSSRSESGVDWVSHSTDGRCLGGQNVRVRIDRDYWSSLGRHGAAMDSRTVDEAVAGMAESIAHKRLATDRGELTLVLDATRASGSALPAVTLLFTRKHKEWASSLGFEAIYIVGPNSTLTSRLA